MMTSCQSYQPTINTLSDAVEAHCTYHGSQVAREPPSHWRTEGLWLANTLIAAIAYFHVLMLHL